MKLRTAAFVLLLPALAVAQAKLEFKTFTSKAHGFSVLLPATPKEETAKLPSPFGELTIHAYLTETNDGKVAWIVTSSDYPAGTVKDENRDNILDGVVKGSAEGVKGKLLTQSKIALDKKYAGRSMQAEVPTTGIYHARVYLVGDRLYQIVVLGPKDVATGVEATKFLDSFKLVK